MQEKIREAIERSNERNIASALTYGSKPSVQKDTVSREEILANIVKVHDELSEKDRGITISKERLACVLPDSDPIAFSQFSTFTARITDSRTAITIKDKS